MLQSEKPVLGLSAGHFQGQKYPVECDRKQIRLLVIQQNSGTQVLLLVFFALTIHVKKAQILLLFSSYGLFPCHAANSPVAPGCNSCEQCLAIETTGQWLKLQYLYA
ncbi:3-hydroxydecanoyl-[acyl-carrier-protein] dehydratase [Trichinella pseudospiralis]